jgi:hypothetical protein
MLHERLFLILEDLLQIPIRHLILEFELLNLRCECEPLILDLIDGPLDIAPLILQLLVRDSQLLQCLLLLVELLLYLKDLLLQALGLLLAAFAASTGHLALHLLNLELSIVQELLLSLLLLLEFDDVGLQVSRGREGARNVSNQIGLLSSQLEQLLRLLEKGLFLQTDFLLYLLMHVS